MLVRFSIRRHCTTSTTNSRKRPVSKTVRPLSLDMMAAPP
jgi:hypothetical protein